MQFTKAFSATSGREQSRLRLASAGLAIVVLIVYLPVVFSEFVGWDDSLFITNNPRFNPPTLHTFFYYLTHTGFNLYMPLTYGFWVVLAKIGYVDTPDALGTRLNPYLFHLGGVLLHVIATVAVFAIIRRAIGVKWPAFAGALFFALHPLQVESVAFIGTMNTPLAGALCLVSIALYLRSVDSGNRRLYWLASLFLLLSLFCKPTAVVAPCIAFFLDWAIFRPPVKTLLKRILPWFLLVLPCVIWTKLIQINPPSASTTPIWSRPLIAAHAMAFYVAKLLFPSSLAIDYGLTPAYVFRHASMWGAWIIPATLLGLAWTLRRRWPVLAAGVGIFFLAMLPNSGIVPFEYQSISNTADRYVYLSMLGAALVFGSIIARLTTRIAIPIAVMILLLCTAVTENQCRFWRNGEAMFRHAIAVNPQSWMSRSDLANIIADRAPDEAIAQCRLAVELNPSDAYAQNNLASLLMDRSPDEALVHCQAALKVAPNFAGAWTNLGTVRLHQSNPTAALDAFVRAHQLEPESAMFTENYAFALLAAGRSAEAAELYQADLMRHPDSADAKAGLARAIASRSAPTRRQ